MAAAREQGWKASDLTQLWTGFADRIAKLHTSIIGTKVIDTETDFTSTV